MTHELVLRRFGTLNKRVVCYAVWKLLLFPHHRKQAGAAAVRLAEGEAEVAEAGVADFERGFGHVVFAGAEQFRRAVHAKALQVLRDRRAGLLQEGAAQVKCAAAPAWPEGCSRPFPTRSRFSSAGRRT